MVYGIGRVVACQQDPTNIRGFFLAGTICTYTYMLLDLVADPWEILPKIPHAWLPLRH